MAHTLSCWIGRLVAAALVSIALTSTGSAATFDASALNGVYRTKRSETPKSWQVVIHDAIKPRRYAMRFSRGGTR